MHRIDRAVFVDRYGRRRRVVIGLGTVLSLMLLGWLALVGVGVATALIAG
jgi:hypothetical protein